METNLIALYIGLSCITILIGIQAVSIWKERDYMAEWAEKLFGEEQ